MMKKTQTQRPTNTNSSSKQKQRLHFRFSNFQALQVPKGWDRLFVFLISVETGKTIAKLGKALVKNGSCQWNETLSESFHISTDTDSLKGHEDCLVKLLVSSGSTRSNILGETSINVAHYAGSRASAAVSQPLKKCSYGTILQVKVQRLASRSKSGEEESKKSKFDEKDENVDGLDLKSVSFRSDNSSDSSGKPLKEDNTASRSLKLESKEGSESASGSSQEEYTGRENSSLNNGVKSEEYDSAARKVGGSINGGLNLESYSFDDGDDDSSNQPSVNSRLYLGDNLRSEMKPKMNIGSSRKHMEVAEDTVEELRAEAQMWERNARKLMVDLDVSRNELSKLSKKHAEMRMELSASYTEQDGLKREVEKLANPTVHSQSVVLMRKELENEIKYQKDMNEDLGQQLKQSQESNAELVSVLQELEDTIGKQRIEIVKYEKVLRDKSDELENERESNRHKILIKKEEIANLDNNERNLVREVESLREKVEELERDCTELTDENLELLLKLKDSKEMGIRRCSSVDSVSNENRNVCLSDESVVSDPRFQNDGFEHLSEILKQVDFAFHLLNETNASATEISPECIISLLQELNKLLETRMVEFDEIMRNHEMEIKDRDDVIADARKKIEGGILEVQQLEESNAKSEENYAHLINEGRIQISDLQQKNTKVERENHELHEKFSGLVDQLNGSKKSLSDCAKRVQLLEDHLTLKLEDFEVRENSLKSDIEALIKEASYQKDKLAQEIQSAELKIQELTDENGRILKLLASYKKSEEKLKADLNDLELKHTKEAGILKMQLQNMSGLKGEISMLKSELKGCRVDKGRMEIELHTISGDYEELKAENIQLSETMSEFEECKRNKLHLEEKLLEMGKDLAAKEILCVQNADLKNKLTEMKRANIQIQQNMCRLEEERDEWLKKAQGLEENLKAMEERNKIHNEVVERERFKRAKSSLEAELIDLRERYLEMSLKYAQVEEQREDLVMKLKVATGGKRWFL